MRSHIFGHSLGGFVALSTIQGPSGDNRLRARVDTVVLVQAAVPSTCFGPGGDYVGLPGKYVAGVTVVTYSDWDSILSKVYRAYDVLAPPLGHSGASGLPVKKLAVTEGREVGRSFGLRPASIVNVDASEVIRCHSDHTAPSLLALMWEAIGVTDGTAEWRIG